VKQNRFVVAPQSGRSKTDSAKHNRKLSKV